MIINTQQLHYLTEIERTRSISHAAANLGIGQPNLSRLLRDTEESIGFPIFDRTRTGVRPTEKGAQFLVHARNILREQHYMEQLGPNSSHSNRFRICLPRSYVCLDMVQKYLSALEDIQELDVIIRECHPRQALDLITGGEAEIGLIRYGMEYHDYFLEQAHQRMLTLRPLSQTDFQIVLNRNDSLAHQDVLSTEDLSGYTELVHRDTFYPASEQQELKGRIYAVDRMAQLQLLQSLPGTYLWAEPLPEKMLKVNGLVQKPCKDRAFPYQNTLIFKPQRAMSDAERDFLRTVETCFPRRKSRK